MKNIKSADFCDVTDMGENHTVSDCANDRNNS